MIALSFISMYILMYNGRLTLALSTDWTYHSRAGWKIDLLVSGATIFPVGAFYRAAERLTALLVLNWNHTLPSRSAAAIALTLRRYCRA